jgi:hypothetical protein
MTVYWIRQKRGKFFYEVGDLECSEWAKFMYFGKNSHGKPVNKWRGELYFTKLDVLQAIYKEGKYSKGMEQEIQASMRKYPHLWV